MYQNYLMMLANCTYHVTDVYTTSMTAATIQLVAHWYYLLHHLNVCIGVTPEIEITKVYSYRRVNTQDIESLITR